MLTYFRRMRRWARGMPILSLRGGAGLVLGAGKTKEGRKELAVAPALAALGGFPFLSADARRLEVLPAAYLGENAVLLDALIEPLEEALEGLAFS